MSAGNFGSCFAFTIGEEGHYSDDPRDPGNWTSGTVGTGTLVGSCWGIAAPTLVRWLGPSKADTVTTDYMKSLKLEIARAIYQAQYWNELHCDELPAGLDLAVWDFGVNAGTRRSVKCLQAVLGVPVDGYIGPQTLAAAASKDVPDTIHKLIQAHVAFYKADPQFSVFGKGWLNRQTALETAAIQMATKKETIVTATTVQPARRTTPKMGYKFSDRLKEWTTYVGAAAAGIGAVAPFIVPQIDNHTWATVWQAAQMLIGAAMIFIPHTAGTTAVENDSLTLLRALAHGLPPQYAKPMQPVITTLAGAIITDEMPGSADIAIQTPTTPVVMAKPVAQPLVQQEAKAGVKPLVADPAAALSPL